MYKRGLRLCRLVLILSILFSFPPLLYAQEKYNFALNNKRNPFIPLITPEGLLLELDREETGVSELHLEGIIYDPQGLSYAMISGVILKVGDSIGNYEVLNIQSRKVILIKDIETIELELKKED